MLRAQIDWQNRAVRIDPSGAAPIIGFRDRASSRSAQSQEHHLGRGAPGAGGVDPGRNGDRMKGQQLVVIASPGLSAGFALAGVPVFEARDGTDAALQIDHLVDDMNAGVIIMDEPLYEDLPEEVKRDLRKSAHPPSSFPCRDPNGRRRPRHTSTSSRSSGGPLAIG